MHKIHFRPGSAAGELTTLHRTPSRMVRGHLSPRFLPLDVRSQDIQNGGVIGPRDNVFPGPAVALDGPVPSCRSTNLKRSTGWCDVCWVVVYIPPTAKNSCLYEIISRLFPGHWALTNSIMNLTVVLTTQATVKNLDWLIDRFICKLCECDWTKVKRGAQTMVERCRGNRKSLADAQMMLADSACKIDYIRMQQLRLRNMKSSTSDEDRELLRVLSPKLTH